MTALSPPAAPSAAPSSAPPAVPSCASSPAVSPATAICVPEDGPPGDGAGAASACRALVLGPRDSADVVGWFDVEDRTGIPRRETVVVVLHRSAGAWTHVYRIVEPARGRRQVKLEKVFSGDRASAARAWARAALDRPLARPLP